MRRHLTFSCAGETLVGTIDDADGGTGLLLVSGGNEIRSGAHAGQAELSHRLASQGVPVFRYDRRGIGDSSGENFGFLASAEDIAAAAAAFRSAAPHVTRIIAFGNCDAASALALYHSPLPIDGLILANPWVIESESALPPPAAVRSRYLQKLKDPKALWGLVSGKINFAKLARGLRQAATRQETSGLARSIAVALEKSAVPVTILVAEHDRTAQVFLAAWNSADFAAVRGKMVVQSLDSGSHSFASAGEKAWLEAQIVNALV